jgi:tRNA G46 methylase TrmB
MDDKLYAQFSITYQEEKLVRKKRVGEWIKNSLLPLQSSNDRQSLNLEIGCGHGHWLSSTKLRPVNF